VEISHKIKAQAWVTLLQAELQQHGDVGSEKE